MCLVYGVLDTVDDKFTGRVKSVIDSQLKHQAIMSILEAKDSQSITTFAFGDSTGDADMLRAVDYPFVVNPHQPEIREMAKKHNWRVIESEAKVIPTVEEIITSLS